jgi:hypothetical protein
MNKNDLPDEHTQLSGTPQVTEVVPKYPFRLQLLKRFPYGLNIPNMLPFLKMPCRSGYK